MSQDVIEDLLVEWELARQDDRELSIDDLCADCPELIEPLRELTEKLTATSWMVANETDDPAEIDRQHYDQERITNDAAGENGGALTPADGRTTADLLDSLAASGLLPDGNISRLRDAIPAAENDNPAVQLAERLIADGVLTGYQAAVLLQQQHGPLRLDRYVILDRVGSGGMGLVYKAMHRSMERIVALKMLPTSALDSFDKLARFRRETKTAGRLSHPNIVTAFDAHKHDGTPFLVMEYVDGLDLRAHVQQHGPFSVADTVRIGSEVAGAMAEAHRQAIVHRDIKPSNILLSTDGEVKLLDLGLARIQPPDQSDGDNSVTGDGLALGTVAFMSPEQALDARQADERSDIYSLGCTLFYLITGRAPFDEATLVQTIVAHREQDVPSLRMGNPSVPKRFEAVVSRMLAKDADDRPQSMDEVRRQLLACDVADETGDIRSTSAAATIRKIGNESSMRRWPRITRRDYLAGAALILVVFAVWMITRPVADSQPDTRSVALWVLQHGGRLDIETEFVAEEITERDQLPVDDFEIVAAYFDGTSAISIKPILSLTTLRSLGINGIPVTVDEVAVLMKNPRLSYLELWMTEMDSRHLQHIGNMRALTFLNIYDENSAVDDAGLELLTRLPRLQELHIGGPGITDAGMVDLARMQSLEFLELSSTSITGNGLERLASLEYLSYLTLYGMRIEPSHITGLSKMEHLRDLTLDYCDIDTDALAGIGRLTNLDALSLVATQLSDNDLPNIVALSQLRDLDLSENALTTRGLQQLSLLPQLEVLRLAGLIIDDELIEWIASLERLEMLDLSGTSINDDQLRTLVSLKRLSTLIVFATAVTRSGAEWFESRMMDCVVDFE